MLDANYEEASFRIAEMTRLAVLCQLPFGSSKDERISEHVNTQPCTEKPWEPLHHRLEHLTTILTHNLLGARQHGEIVYCTYDLSDSTRNRDKFQFYWELRTCTTGSRRTIISTMLSVNQLLCTGYLRSVLAY